MELIVEHRPDAPSILHITLNDDEPLVELTDALALGANAGDDTIVWLHGTNAERRETMANTGRTTRRTLLQMRLPLPVARAEIETVAFDPATDVEEFISVNNRAFSWHPEQAGLTREMVDDDMAASWFNAEGFRLHRIDGALAGFCWTKVHEATSNDPALGEIYVIAVDPPFHGQGLGTQMTLAGLNWLQDAGLEHGMLYVESDNTAAVATYEKLGFVVHREDTLWRFEWN